VFEGGVAQKCDSPGEHALSVSREAELARVSGKGQGWLDGDSAGRPERMIGTSPGRGPGGSAGKRQAYEVTIVKGDRRIA
jgi:hypothetical protein